MGVSLRLLCLILLALRKNKALLKPVLILGLVLLVLTRHFSANLTHGDNFVFAPLQKPYLKTTRVLTDSTTIFNATITPIFESKCFSCHSDQKAKGRLVLTSVEKMMKEGKNGKLWHPGDPTHSLLVKRLSLPLEHKEHMPPR